MSLLCGHELLCFLSGEYNRADIDPALVINTLGVVFQIMEFIRPFPHHRCVRDYIQRKRVGIL